VRASCNGSRGYGMFSHRKVPTLRGNLLSPSFRWRDRGGRFFESVGTYLSNQEAPNHRKPYPQFHSPNDLESYADIGFSLLECKTLPSVVNIRNCLQLRSRLVFGTIEYIFHSNINYSMNNFIPIFNIRMGIKLLCTNEGDIINDDTH
jgi:hypothetical protein